MEDRVAEVKTRYDWEIWHLPDIEEVEVTGEIMIMDNGYYDVEDFYKNDVALPCPICKVVPEPYFTEGLDSPFDKKHWYVHCKDEDDHNDGLDEDVIQGGYGELDKFHAIDLWNKSVENYNAKATQS